MCYKVTGVWSELGFRLFAGSGSSHVRIWYSFCVCQKYKLDIIYAMGMTSIWDQISTIILEKCCLFLFIMAAMSFSEISRLSCLLLFFRFQCSHYIHMHHVIADYWSKITLGKYFEKALTVNLTILLQYRCISSSFSSYYPAKCCTADLFSSIWHFTYLNKCKITSLGKDNTSWEYSKHEALRSWYVKQEVWYSSNTEESVTAVVVSKRKPESH